MTVELKNPKTKSSSATEAVGPKPVDLKDILDVDPLLQGQALLAANKKRKKQQKRAGKTHFIFPASKSTLRQASNIKKKGSTMLQYAGKDVNGGEASLHWITEFVEKLFI